MQKAEGTKMMRGKGVIFLILSAALLLWSCAVTDADPTDYAGGEFIALISGRAGEVNFSATLWTYCDIFL